MTAPTDTRPAEPEPSTPIDPRMRARRIAVRRDEGRKRLHRLIALAVVAALALGAVLATRSPLLNVDHVEITGALHTPPAAILSAGHVSHGTSMFQVDLASVRGRIDALPWIASANVARHWPGTIDIAVVERTPVANVGGGTNRWLLVDGAGRVLEAGTAPKVGLPILESVTASLEPGQALPASAARLLVVASTIPGAIQPQVFTVRHDATGLTLTLAPCGIVELGDGSDLRAKMLAAQTVLTDVSHSGRGQGIGVLDVRVASAPVLTRDPNCANVSTATGG